MRTNAMDTDLLSGLNPEQTEVVNHENGPLVVGAVAGAGKTTALIRRIARLVAVCHVPGDRILATTFSVKAAKEMNDRLASTLPNSGAMVGTIHGLAYRICRDELVGFDRWQVDDADRYRFCVKDAVGYKSMDWKGSDLTVITQYITRCKARCAQPGTQRALDEANAFYEKLPSPQRNPNLLAEAYRLAEEGRRAKRLITYDDMLLEAWHLLTSDEMIRGRWASRWDYVMQDEAQDENLVQREILAALARDHRNYMIVGDPAQSIYAFRGSDPSGILSFEATWGAKKILMHRNYRSGDSIIGAANGVLGAMAPHTHLGATITPCRGIAGTVSGRIYQDSDDEADDVIERIALSHADGARWSDHVVLYRTNAMSRPLEEALLSARVPYVIVGGVNFYERREVKDLLAYLRLAGGRGSADDVRRAINAPFRFLGKAFVDGLMELVDRMGTGQAGWTRAVRNFIGSARGLQSRQRTNAEQWCAIIDEVAACIARKDPTSKPAVIIERILRDTDYVQWLQRDEGSESTENSRVSNVRELVRASERFTSVADLLDYVDEQIAASKRAKHEGGADRVTLMSIHRSKGLEWPTVYVVGVNDRVLPHARAEDMDEERRLAYVAFTRARDELNVSCVRVAAISTRVVELPVSQFIAEAGIELREETVGARTEDSGAFAIATADSVEDLG